MKKFHFLLLIASLAIVIATSCNKEENKVSIYGTNTEKALINPTFLSECYNLADYHNAVLTFVGNNCVPNVNNRETRFNLAQKYMGTANVWNASKVIIDTIQYFVENGGAANAIATLGVFSDTAILILQQIENVYNQALAEDSIIFTPKQFLGSLYAIADYVITNHNVEYNNITGITNEYGVIIAMCVLAEASYNFWYAQLMDIKGDWHDLIMPGGGPVGNYCKGAIKRAAVDAWAYVSAWYDDNSTPVGATVTITSGGHTWDSTTAAAAASAASAACK